MSADVVAMSASRDASTGILTALSPSAAIAAKSSRSYVGAPANGASASTPASVTARIGAPPKRSAHGSARAASGASSHVSLAMPFTSHAPGSSWFLSPEAYTERTNASSTPTAASSESLPASYSVLIAFASLTAAPPHVPFVPGNVTHEYVCPSGGSVANAPRLRPQSGATIAAGKSSASVGKMPGL